MNLLAAFFSYARMTPEHPFLRHAGQTITYGDMQARSRRTAAVLQARGVGSGDRIALMCFNTPGFVDVLLGAWRLGATIVPVNHKLQAPEVEYILNHCEARMIVFDAALAPVMAKVNAPAARMTTAGGVPGLEHLDAVLDGVDGIDGIVPADDSIAEILYTSGTTGKPKGCLHTHRTVVLAAMNAALATSITRMDRLLLAMPIWHSSPLNNWFGGVLYMGGTVVLLREYHPQQFVETVQAERITVYFGAPVSYFAPLQLVPTFADYDLSSVRAWIYGGGPIGAEMARKLSAAYRSDRFFQVYGMTETGPLGTALYPAEQVAKAGSIGRVATPGIEVRVVRLDGGDAGPGEIGEIWLRGGSVMQGYLDDAAATRQAFADGGWYRSGDLARLDEDRYLFIADRTKDMIITGGENVYSKEVEDALLAHPGVADAAVVGRPDPEWGETVVAHIVVRPQSQVDGEVLSAFLADKLARYKIPREYCFPDTLPRTPTGKVQKYLLRTGRS